MLTVRFSPERGLQCLEIAWVAIVRSSSIAASASEGLGFGFCSFQRSTSDSGVSSPRISIPVWVLIVSINIQEIPSSQALNHIPWTKLASTLLPVCNNG